MVVKYSKGRKHNFEKGNIEEILLQTGDPEIISIVNDKKDFILIVGNIHRSQYTHDNPYGYHWLKIQGYKNNALVSRLSAVHLYLCYNLFQPDKFGYYHHAGCVIPNDYPGTDVANVENMFGRWDLVGISHGHRFGKKRKQFKKTKSKKS